MYSAREGDAQNVRCLLQGSINIPFISRFFKSDVDVNAANEDGITALMLAAAEGHTGIVRQLVASGANVNAATTNNEFAGDTALILAASRGHTDIVRLLMEKGANLNAAITAGEITGFTALMGATEEGHTDVAQLLIEKGADVNTAVKKTGVTPLMVAAKKGHTEIARLLIQKGADVEATDACGRSAATHAKINGHDAAREIIRNAGGKVWGWELLRSGSSCAIEKLLDDLPKLWAKLHYTASTGK